MVVLSVIIPIRNEQKHIAQTLDMLSTQKPPLSNGGYEFLVIDGISTDNTKEIVQAYCAKYPNVRYFENPKKLSSAARNIGVKNAEGKYVLIVDGHCIVDNKEMLANVVKAFETTEADILARPQPLELKDATPLQLAVAAARRSRLGHHPDSFIYSGQAQWCPASSAGIAYRKKVFDTVGYFDETFDACEDVEFNTRCDKAGLKCWFDPAIAVSYVPRNSLPGLFYQMMRYGKGRVKLFRKHPETFSLKTFGLGLFVFCVIAGFILLLAGGTAYTIVDLQTPRPWTPETYGLPTILGQSFGLIGAIYGCVLALYSLAVLFESLRLTLSTSRQTAGLNRFRMFAHIPQVFITLHFGFGWGILRETLRRPSGQNR
ncbi:MAG: glycosyltransferase family 2 protein [Planctomycetaceae bacterium]|nr:glycosyltransferase family 2 protein [Planctomycetaceae bacterium]